MLGWIAKTYRMSEAAVIVQTVLEQVAPASLSSYSPKDLSSKLVARTWQSRLDLFEGKNHPNLNRIAIAAVSLASGLQFFPEDNDADFICLALGQLLLDLHQNGHKYSFNAADHRVIAASNKAYIDRMEVTNDRTSSVVGSLGL